MAAAAGIARGRIARGTGAAKHDQYDIATDGMGRRHPRRMRTTTGCNPPLSLAVGMPTASGSIGPIR